jgi:hypothetical protein
MGKSFERQMNTCNLWVHGLPFQPGGPTNMPRTRRNEYRKIAKDFLRRAKNAPTEAEREDFLDMARAIERAAVKVKRAATNPGQRVD